MPPTDHEQLQEVVALALVRRGKSGSAHAVADAAVGLFRELSSRLTPLIGERGVEVLLGRAVHLTSGAFPWLDLADEKGDGSAPVSALHAHLAARDAKEASTASQFLLVTFTELLATLIGSTLTRRLLAPVWSAPELETQHE